MHMLKESVRQLRPALTLLFVFTVALGIVYPSAVTAVAQLVFPHQANGSLIERGGKIVGSELIGQPFTGPRYFVGRPSATAPFPCNAAASSGSNMGISNPALREAAVARLTTLRQYDPQNKESVPVDLVTASGSGLDPQISPAAAEFQVSRVARARGMSEEAVRDLVQRSTEERQLGVLGEPRVNVLQLNLALDKASER
jgi:potassium-transporting ATPase KdpC subunit